MSNIPVDSQGNHESGSEGLIRLQPIPQSSKLRGPGSGSDDDLSILEDPNGSSNGPDGGGIGNPERSS